MATLPTLLTPRDTDILTALDRVPLTVRQLLRLSETFARCFGSERHVRQRLQSLAHTGLVRRFQFAAVNQGTSNYYTLSPTGFRVLYGLDEPLPHANAFRAVGIARLAHTQALADFLVHTTLAAHHSGITLHRYNRENTVQLTVGTESFFPDGSFQLVTLRGHMFSFFVELDNATERVRSEKAVDSWERKLRLYEKYQDQCPKRFRLLVVTTGTAERLQHILSLAARLARNPTRSLTYGITLPVYLGQHAALTMPCFTDHRLQPVALISGPREQPVFTASPPTQVPAAATGCR